jgi:hypothetical protein
MLVDGGFPESRVASVIGAADHDPLLPADPLAAANRRIAILVLRQAPVVPETAAAAPPARSPASRTPNPLVPNPLVPNALVPNPLVPNPLPNPLVPNGAPGKIPSPAPPRAKS